LFQTGLVVGHLVPHSARHQRADAVLDRLSEGARQVRTIVRHVPPSPSRPGVVTTVTPLIETLTTTIAALDRRVDGGGLPELTSSGKHLHSQRSRLTADDADLARTLTALHDLDNCLISIGASDPNLAGSGSDQRTVNDCGGDRSGDASIVLGEREVGRDACTRRLLLDPGEHEWRDSRARDVLGLAGG
jgi:hypothetical protein